MSLRLQSNSIATLLTRMNLVVSGTVLLIAALAFFSYDLLSFRQNLVRNLNAEAQIIGDNTVSALLFNDQQSAVVTLESLQRSPDVLAAVLTTNDGIVFARYQAPGQSILAPRPLAPSQQDAEWSAGIHITVVHRIVFEGKPAGIVYISATLREIERRARRYLLIACIVLLFCMGAALAISSLSRRLIATLASSVLRG